MYTLKQPKHAVHQSQTVVLEAVWLQFGVCQMLACIAASSAGSWKLIVEEHELFGLRI